MRNLPAKADPLIISFISRKPRPVGGDLHFAYSHDAVALYLLLLQNVYLLNTRNIFQNSPI
jgi:hypothetical protein